MVTDTLRIPEFSELQDARRRIAERVVCTPVVHVPELDQALDCQVWLKCENHQRTGAFKLRGATNAVARLREEGIATDVATHSSGNHGAALAQAASDDGRSARVVMPRNAVQAKVENVQNRGGDVIFCEPGQAPREAGFQKLVESGLVPIPPYDHTDIMAGQGTAAMELLDEAPDLDCLVTPVGGGTLLAGSAIGAQGIHPGIRVFGAEPEGAADAHHSFHSGQPVDSWNPKTIADGLRAVIGPMSFRVIADRVEDILLVSEAEIEVAMKLVLDTTGMLIEPSSAVTVAAIRRYPEIFGGTRTGVILSGGNVDRALFDWLEASDGG